MDFSFVLIKLLENTFFGTLLAGGLLGVLGYRRYRKQKLIDIKCDDFKKIRGFASALFACLETADSDFSAHLNMNDDSNQQIKVLKEAIIRLGGDIHAGVDKLFNSHVSEINIYFKRLIAELKSNPYFDAKYSSEIEILNKEIPTLIFYLSAVPILVKIGNSDIDSLRQNFSKSLKAAEVAIKRIIDAELIF